MDEFNPNVAGRSMPIDFPKTPAPTNELEKAALAECYKLDSLERDIAACYWRLGEILQTLRDQRERGEWKPYLAGLGINYNRAARAIRIRRKYTTPEECSGMGLIEALAYQPREDEDAPAPPPPTVPITKPRLSGRNPQLQIAEEEEEEIEEERIEVNEALVTLLRTCETDERVSEVLDHALSRQLQAS